MENILNECLKEFDLQDFNVEMLFFSSVQYQLLFSFQGKFHNFYDRLRNADFSESMSIDAKFLSV